MRNKRQLKNSALVMGSLRCIALNKSLQDIQKLTNFPYLLMTVTFFTDVF